ncbi:hypothetical protein [Aeromicrobium alkaliterrae]|uniref:Leucine rich repeat variant domain-containing protein n=1 Tax=Aeromicrobium alkaliterrae TaxID=302168 RepID=A0ABP4VPP1_9ACTN
MATDETRYEASNPQTAPARLQELTSDPELWPLIAANPAAYDSLVAWLGENGGDEVRAAIASRGAAPAGPALPPPGGYAPAPAAYAAPVGPQGSKGPSKKGLWITLGILIFLLVGSGTGVGVWALTKGDDSSTTSDDDQKDTKDSDDRKTSDDDDKKSDDEDDEPVEVDCDALEDFEDAASDLTLYYPGLDDEDDLLAAIEVIEPFADSDDQDLAGFAEALLTYADAIEEDEDAIVGPEWSDALDAKYELMDYVLDEC